MSCCIFAVDNRLASRQPCDRPRSCGVRPGARTGTQRRADLRSVPREKALSLSKRQERIDAILEYQFPGWLLAAALVAVIVAVRLFLAYS